MDGFAVLMTQLKWLANVTHDNVPLTSVIDIGLISLYTVFYWVFILFVISCVAPSPMNIVHFTLGVLAHLYRLYYGLENTSIDDKSWDKFRNIVANLFRYCGRFYHGYEVEGLENIPTEGSAVLVAYHGPSFYDYVFMESEIYLHRNRIIRILMHKCFARIPGFWLLMDITKSILASRENCLKHLKDGHMILIAPGGTYEAFFSDHNYQLQWRNHLGYARVAIEAQSPIIPVFTVNYRESYRSINIATNWRKALYEKWRIEFAILYGGFPVKLRTIIGKPIAFDPALTAEELNIKVMLSMEKLIRDNQRLPGSITRALLDRVKRRRHISLVKIA